MLSSICNVQRGFAHPDGTLGVRNHGMKRPLFAVLILLMSTSVAFGATTNPDYSRDTILKILHDKENENQRFKMNVGTVDINTAAMRYHFAYLPLLAPLPYSGPQGARFLPNPFVLTHTEYAWQPHQYQALPDAYYSDRDYQREYKRVSKMLRKQHIVVTQ